MYSWLISEWRRVRDAGVLAGKAPGDRIGKLSAEQVEIARLRRQLEQSERKLATTQEALDIMGKSESRTWLTASIVGVVGILLAFGSGLAFMGQTSNNVASFCMALGCALAIAGYTHGLYRIPTNSH